ncbi:hypothetical protein HQN90_38290 [Paenibacillus alba]|nr:hypothetical protein [Paenibacillus alba]
MMRQDTGAVALETPQGIEAFYRGFASGQDQVMVVAGEIERLINLLGGTKSRKMTHASHTKRNIAESGSTAGQNDNKFYQDIINEVIEGRLTEDQFIELLN